MAINYSQAQYINQENQKVLTKLLSNTGKINALTPTHEDSFEMVKYLSTQENQKNYQVYLEKVSIFLIEHDLINLYQKTNLKLANFALTCAAFATKLVHKDYEKIIQKKIKIKDKLQYMQTHNGRAYIEEKKMYLGLNFGYLGDNVSDTSQYDFLYWHEFGHILQFEGKSEQPLPEQENHLVSTHYNNEDTTNKINNMTIDERPFINPLVNNDVKDNIFYNSSADIMENRILNLFLTSVVNISSHIDELSTLPLEFNATSLAFASLHKELYADTYAVLMLGLKNPESFEDILKTTIDFRIQDFAYHEKIFYQQSIQENKDNFDTNIAKCLEKASEKPQHNILFTHNTSYGLLALKDTLEKYNLSDPKKWYEQMDFSIVDLICKEVATIGYARQLLITLACNEYLIPIMQRAIDFQENNLMNIIEENKFDKDSILKSYWVNQDYNLDNYESFIQYMQKIAKTDWVEDSFTRLGKEHFYFIYDKEYNKINSKLCLTYYKQDEALTNGYMISDKRKYLNQLGQKKEHQNQADTKIKF